MSDFDQKKTFKAQALFRKYFKIFQGQNLIKITFKNFLTPDFEQKLF